MAYAGRHRAPQSLMEQAISGSLAVPLLSVDVQDLARAMHVEWCIRSHECDGPDRIDLQRARAVVSYLVSLAEAQI